MRWIIKRLGPILLSGFVSVSGLPRAVHAEPPPPPESATISRGLSYVRDAGNRWIEDRGCVSCHQVPTLIWSHQIERPSGASDDDQQLKQWWTWSTDVVNFVKPHRKTDVDVQQTMAANIDTMTQLLLAAPPDASADWRTRMVDALVENQQTDGSWKPCGQLPMQRRPLRETQATTTAWTALALLREGADFDLTNAQQFIDTTTDPVSTEYLTVRLLLASRMQDANAKSWVHSLLASQNKDGGWGWRRDEDSDALGTGYAMYALAVTDSDPEAIRRGREFLIRTQQDDGSWTVPGTKKSAKGRPTETAIDWGSAWAVIGLTAARDSVSDEE